MKLRVVQIFNTAFQHTFHFYVTRTTVHRSRLPSFTSLLFSIYLSLVATASLYVYDPRRDGPRQLRYVVCVHFSRALLFAGPLERLTRSDRDTEINPTYRTPGLVEYGGIQISFFVFIAPPSKGRLQLPMKEEALCNASKLVDDRQMLGS
jgi:hypothetical protein